MSLTLAVRPDRDGVAPEIVEARVADALAAGGRMVADRPPLWWTLADTEGNEADVAGWIGRD